MQMSIDTNQDKQSITCKHSNLYPKQKPILIYCVKCQCKNEFYLTQSLEEKAPECKGGQSPSKKQQKLNQDKLSAQNNFAQASLNQNITQTTNQQVKQQKQFEHIQVLIISQQIVYKSYHHSTFETILVQIQNLKCNQCNEQFKKLQIEINQQNQTYFIIQLECENRKCKAELNVHCQIINETQAIAYVSDKNIIQSDAFIKDEIYNFYNQQQQPLIQSQKEKQDKQLQQKQVQQIPQQQQQSIPSSGQVQLNEESKMHLDTNQDNLQYQHLQSENIQTILKEEEIKASTQQDYLVQVLEIKKFQTPKTKNSKQQMICLEIAQLPCIYCYKISKNVKIEDFLDNQCHKYQCQYKQCEKQNYIYIQDYKTPQSISVIMKKELKKKYLEDICKSYEQKLKSGKHQQQIPESNPKSLTQKQQQTLNQQQQLQQQQQQSGKKDNLQKNEMLEEKLQKEISSNQEQAQTQIIYDWKENNEKKDQCPECKSKLIENQNNYCQKCRNSWYFYPTECGFKFFSNQPIQQFKNLIYCPNKCCIVNLKCEEGHQMGLISIQQTQPQYPDFFSQIYCKTKGCQHKSIYYMPCAVCKDQLDSRDEKDSKQKKDQKNLQESRKCQIICKTNEQFYYGEKIICPSKRHQPFSLVICPKNDCFGINYILDYQMGQNYRCYNPKCNNEFAQVLCPKCKESIYLDNDYKEIQYIKCTCKNKFTFFTCKNSQCKQIIMIELKQQVPQRDVQHPNGFDDDYDNEINEIIQCGSCKQKNVIKECDNCNNYVIFLQDQLNKNICCQQCNQHVIRSSEKDEKLSNQQTQSSQEENIPYQLQDDQHQISQQLDKYNKSYEANNEQNKWDDRNQQIEEEKKNQIDVKQFREDNKRKK